MTSDPIAFECPECGMTSHNPTDAAQSYCGNCHVFLDDLKVERSRRMTAALLDGPANLIVAQERIHIARYLRRNAVDFRRRHWNDAASALIDLAVEIEAGKHIVTASQGASSGPEAG